MDTPTSPKYVPKHRRNSSITSDTNITATSGSVTSPIGEFKHSPLFPFTRNGGSPPRQSYPGYGSPPKPSFQSTGSYTSVSANDASNNGASPLGGFKYSPSFSFAKNGSPPKHYAHDSPPKAAFMHRRRSSAAEQSSNWRVCQPETPVVDDSTEPSPAETYPSLNVLDNGTHTILCPKSMGQLFHNSNVLHKGRKVVPSLGKAEQLIAFSYTNEHRQEFNDNSMRYFVEPPLGADLNSGYENWKADSEWRGGIGDLLRAVCHAKWAYEGKEERNENGSSNADKFSMPDIIAWRGNIMKIFLAPYAQHKTDSWELNAMFINGTMYLHPHTSEERKFDRDIKHLTPELQKQTYHGFAFEKYCQSHESLKASGSASPELSKFGEVNVDSTEWCTVVRTALGDMSMIVGAEIDCIKGEYTKQPDCYVELKTVQAPQGAYDLYKFNRKTLRYYLQSATVGIPEIVVGYRSKEGILESYETYRTAELPDHVFGQEGGWNPGLPLTWGHQVLTLLKDVMQKGPKQTHCSSSVAVWRMEFDMESSALTIRELDDQEVEAVVNGRNYVGFLPKWYLDAIYKEEWESPGHAT